LEISDRLVFLAADGRVDSRLGARPHRPATEQAAGHAVMAQ